MDAVVTPGTQVGNYQIEGLIGQGGMAQVYKAWHPGLHRHEALKLLPPQMTFDQGFVARFLTEARTAAGLRHPNIATIHTVSQPNEAQPFFTMELVDGCDLADLIQKRGHLSLEETVPILRQIASALDYAHSHGIVHRDVKPANALLEQAGDGHWNVKVVDFGIARAQEAGQGARLTKTGMIVGTPEYMSPEQGGSGLPIDHRTDIYSLGVIAYEMLCGKPPFSVGPQGTAMTVIMSHIRDLPRAPLEHAAGLPLPANNAILKALAKHPEDRFKNCSDFVDAMTGLVAVSIPSLLPVSPSNSSASLRKPVPQIRWMPALLGVVILIGIVLISLGLMKRGHEATTDANLAAAPNAIPSSQSSVADTRNNKIKVPDFVGLKEAQARAFGTATALHLEELTSASTSVAPGCVVSQSPSPGVKVMPSSSVTIRVSTGPGPTQAEAVPVHRADYSPPVSTSYSAPSNDEYAIASARRLTETDLAGKSDWELTLLRNSVYARHGYRFHRAELQSYFSSQSWYSPTSDDQNAVHREFSSIEAYNVLFVSAYQKSHPKLLMSGGE